MMVPLKIKLKRSLKHNVHEKNKLFSKTRHQSTRSRRKRVRRNPIVLFLTNNMIDTDTPDALKIVPQVHNQLIVVTHVASNSTGHDKPFVVSTTQVSGLD